MQNIDIHLKPSRQFVILTSLTVLGGLVIIYHLQCFFWIKVLLTFFALIYGWRVLRSYGLLIGKDAVKGLRKMSDNNWLLLTRHKEIIARLAGESTVTSQLCVLRFTIADKRSKRSCIILRDSLDPEQYRKLLVLLYCYKP